MQQSYGHMPRSMIESRTEIMLYLSQGLSIAETSRKTGHGRNLVRKVKTAMVNGDNSLFLLKHKLGAPLKQSTEMESYISDITKQNRRLSSKTCAALVSEQERFPNVSATLVWNIRHKLKFDFLAPVHTFLLSDRHKALRLAFAQNHLNLNTNWRNVLFTDESSFILDNNHRWMWRRRGEKDDAVLHSTSKYKKKIMVFGGISYNHQTPIVFIDGTIDSSVYIDECIDGTELIWDMDRVYGKNQWQLMQDGASCHTSSETMDYLCTYCSVLPEWPPNSPDMNPIENLWAIMKRRVEELNPTNVNELIEIIIDVWNNVSVNEIHNLIDSMNSRLQLVVANGGGRNGY